MCSFVFSRLDLRSEQPTNPIYTYIPTPTTPTILTQAAVAPKETSTSLLARTLGTLVSAMYEKLVPHLNLATKVYDGGVGTSRTSAAGAGGGSAGQRHGSSGGQNQSNQNTTNQSNNNNNNNNNNSGLQNSPSPGGWGGESQTGEGGVAGVYSEKTDTGRLESVFYAAGTCVRGVCLHVEWRNTSLFDVWREVSKLRSPPITA